MTRNSKIGIALVMMILVLITAPAVLCLTYLAHSSHSHSCCPSKNAPSKTVALTCCVNAPAVTSQGVDVQPAQASDVESRVDASLMVLGSATGTLVAELDTSPPLCSSILRI